MTVLEILESQIRDLQTEIKEILEKMEYRDNISQSNADLSKRLAEKRSQLEAMIKFVGQKSGTKEQSIKI